MPIANFIIREFFATENPYDDLLNILTEPQPLFEFPEGRGIKRKEEPLIKTLFLTLSEVRSDLYISIFSFTPILLLYVLFYSFVSFLFTKLFKKLQIICRDCVLFFLYYFIILLSTLLNFDFKILYKMMRIKLNVDYICNICFNVQKRRKK